MFRITTLFLCMLLAAAAVGRYRAEQSVQKTRAELERLEAQQAEELRRIQILRAEVAYLENPERLAKVAAAQTDLRPSTGAQFITPQQFAATIGVSPTTPFLADDPAPANGVANAIAVAQLADAE